MTTFNLTTVGAHKLTQRPQSFADMQLVILGCYDKWNLPLFVRRTDADHDFMAYVLEITPEHTFRCWWHDKEMTPEEILDWAPWCQQFITALSRGFSLTTPHTGALTP